MRFEPNTNIINLACGYCVGVVELAFIELDILHAELGNINILTAISCIQNSIHPMISNRTSCGTYKWNIKLAYSFQP
jgi:hypothetical protein